MSNSYKRFLTTLTAATPAEILVVPAATTAIVRSIIISNVSGSAAVVTLTIAPVGVGSHMLVPALSVADDAYAEILTAPLNLEAADILKITSDQSSVTVTLTALLVDRN